MPVGPVTVHLGFVAICLSEERCSPAGTVTVKLASRLDPEARRYRLLQVARRNLENTLRILFFMKAHGIRLYRISANLIPLATHAITAGWAWWEEPDLRQAGAKIGRTARQLGFRLSSHLPEVCGLSSGSQFRWLRAYLAYHRRLFELLDLDERAKIVIHVGGHRGRVEEAREAARRHLEQLDDWARARLVLENDDRSVDLVGALDLAEEFGLPVAFDWHHHVCRPPAGVTRPADPGALDALAPLLARAFRLWRDRPPKVHLSSPRDARNPRAHADYVDLPFIAPLLELLTRLGVAEVDAMVEAKQKDLALFRLRDQLRGLGGGDASG